MTFLSPVYLWTLAALLPLAAIYLLKVRPTRRPVTALYLYDTVLSQRKATRLLHRLRDLLSLLLMGLAVAALGFALGRPALHAEQRRDLLILVDNSASMSATYKGDTRLAAARETAREIVQALDGGQRAAVAAIADEVAWQAYLTDNPRELLDGIDGIRPSQRPLRCDRIAALVQGEDETRRRRVLLLSDAAAREFALPEGVELLKIGADAENVGIVAADLRVSGLDELQLFLQLASTYDEPRELELALEHDGTLARLVPLQVEPGLNSPAVQAFAGAPGAWCARLRLADALACDNDAYLVATAPPPMTVALSTANRFFFEQSVRAFSGSAGQLELTAESDADVVVAAGGVPEGARRAVVFQPQDASVWWSATDEELDLVIPRVNVPEHPALRYVEIETMTFAGARRVTPASGSIVLVESEGGVPLIWKTTHDGRTVMGVNLAPAQGEFFFQVHFPVLIHSLVTHLCGRSEQLSATYATGQTAPIPGAAADSVTRVRRPDGEVRELTRAHLGPLSTCGHYELENAGGTWTIGASLLSPADSLLGDPAAEDSAQPIARGHSPAYWLITLALGLVLFESVMYHRRKVG